MALGIASASKSQPPSNGKASRGTERPGVDRAGQDGKGLISALRVWALSAGFIPSNRTARQGPGQEWRCEEWTGVEGKGLDLSKEGSLSGPSLLGSQAQQKERNGTDGRALEGKEGKDRRELRNAGKQGADLSKESSSELSLLGSTAQQMGVHRNAEAPRGRDWKEQVSRALQWIGLISAGAYRPSAGFKPGKWRAVQSNGEQCKGGVGIAPQGKGLISARRGFDPSLLGSYPATAKEWRGKQGSAGDVNPRGRQASGEG